MGFGIPNPQKKSDKPDPVGFVFNIKSGDTVQKLAVKENINTLIEDYSLRRIPLLLCTLLGILAIDFITVVTYFIVKKHFNLDWDSANLQTTIFYSSVAGFVISVVGFLYSFPAFETLDKENKFRYKNTKQLISALLVLYGIFLGVIALL